MPSKKNSYLKQKLVLYFDENFPAEIIESLKKETKWKRKYRFHSALIEGNTGKDDLFHFDFCIDKGWTLVTIDRDFMNDRIYPLRGMPGIICLRTGKKDHEKILLMLEQILSFVSIIYLPKLFMGQTKIQVSTNQCVIRGLGAETGHKKSMTVRANTTNLDVMKYFEFL